MQNEPQQGLTLMVSAYCNQQRLPVGGSSQPKSQLLMKKKKEAVCLKSNIPYKCWGWCVCVGGVYWGSSGNSPSENVSGCQGQYHLPVALSREEFDV
jgi:hypothetical protein